MYDFEREELKRLNWERRRGAPDRRDARAIARGEDTELDYLADYVTKNSAKTRNAGVNLGEVRGRGNVVGRDSSYPSIMSNQIRFSSEDVIGKRISQMNRGDEGLLSDDYDEGPDSEISLDEQCPRCRDTMVAVGQSERDTHYRCPECGFGMSLPRESAMPNDSDPENDIDIDLNGPESDPMGGRGTMGNGRFAPDEFENSGHAMASRKNKFVRISRRDEKD